MDPAITLALRCSFALLLASAASHKLRDLARFRAILDAYEILPAATVAAVAPLVAVVEIALSGLLAGGLAAPFSAAATSALMLAYAAALQVNVQRGRTGLDCGCTGPASSVPVSSALVVRNLVLAAAALLIALPSSGRPLAAMDFASAAAAVLVLGTCWLATGRMLALAPRVAELRRRRRPS